MAARSARQIMRGMREEIPAFEGARMREEGIAGGNAGAFISGNEP